MTTLSPCHALAKELKAVIDARILGRQVLSAGHKGRNIAYAETPIKDLIAYYNQVRAGCLDARADPELIALAPFDQPTGTRGRPGRFIGRNWV